MAVLGEVGAVVGSFPQVSDSPAPVIYVEYDKILIILDVDDFAIDF